MRVLGISSQFHDAAASVIEGGEIVFAAHSERYSKKKNDPFLHQNLIRHALSYGTPDAIVYHEKPWAKRLRNLRAGSWHGFAKEISSKQWVNKFYPELKDIPSFDYWHHETHAAAGVFTSEFDSAAVMVIDAIGEFNTASIWHWKDGSLTKKHTVNFPNSLGLFYSAVTAHVGLKPMEDEYILMGMAAYGDLIPSTHVYNQMNENIFTHYRDMSKGKSMKLRRNLQKGFKKTDYAGASTFDIARAAQQHIEERILCYAEYARELTKEKNLVFMGGVALNCVANSNLFNIFDKVHIMPNPGDAGSSLGGALLHYYNRTGRIPKWPGPYLGNNIPGLYPVQKALVSLAQGDIFGIANGRAEFGPRALGNRSLLADPRGGDIKDRLNVIKRRQEFRPFAPVIMEELAADYFTMPCETSPYMQFTAKCRYPERFPAIIHADGTSRVQTVNQQQHPGLYSLLKAFYERTGCPMLVNTSLNVKGQPMVSDELDVMTFSQTYGIAVHLHD